MAVRIRLFRRGRKKMAMYDIVVADARAPRDGRFIEKLGNYNPNTDPATIELNTERAFDWVMNGAQPSDTARTILSNRGVMLRKHLQVGVNKGAITQEAADKKFAEWSQTKESKISAELDGMAKEKAASAKARHEAETKVKEARAEALLKKQSEMIAALEAAEAAAAKAPEGAEVKEADSEAPAETEAVVTETKEVATEAVAEEAKEKPEATAKAEPAEVETVAEEVPAQSETKAEPAEVEPATAEEVAPDAKAKAEPAEVEPAEVEPAKSKEDEAPEAAAKETKKD